MHQFTEEDSIVPETEIPEEKLIKLCKQPCSVRMWRFNVCHSLSIQYKKGRENFNKPVDDQKCLEFINANAYGYYKRYYQPREEWRRRQMMFSRKRRVLNYFIVLNQMSTKIKLEKIKGSEDPQDLLVTSSSEISEFPLEKETQCEEVEDFDPDNQDDDVQPEGNAFSQGTVTSTAPSSENFMKGITVTSTQDFR